MESVEIKQKQEPYNQKQKTKDCRWENTLQVLCANCLKKEKSIRNERGMRGWFAGQGSELFEHEMKCVVNGM